MNSMKTKAVHRIPNTNIVINSWKPRTKIKDKFLRFMTLITPESTLVMERIQEGSYTIYTSVFNHWYLTKFYNVPEHRIVALEYNEPKEIYDKYKKESFEVTAIDANFCVGSMMLLFQGSFGNIFYTGFFRPSRKDNMFEVPLLKDIIEQKSMDIVYIDNTYAAECCKFPKRAEVVERIIDLLKKHPNHYVFISGKRLGKEEILYDIVTTLQEKVCVTQEKFELFQEMGLEKRFTTNRRESRIIALDHILTLDQCRKKKEEYNPCLIILLTAYYEGQNHLDLHDELSFDGFHIVPYSGHCNHSELMQFLSAIEPREIKPIILENGNSKIPQCMYDLCYKPNDLDFRPRKKDVERLNTLQKIHQSEKNNETTFPENLFSQAHAQNLGPMNEDKLNKKNQSCLVENVNNVDDAIIDSDSEFASRSYLRDHMYARSKNRKESNLHIVPTNETDDDNIVNAENCESNWLCNANPFKTDYNEVYIADEYICSQKSILKSNCNRPRVICRDQNSANNKSSSVSVYNFCMNNAIYSSRRCETDGSNTWILDNENTVTVESQLLDSEENINQLADCDGATFDKNTYTITKQLSDVEINSSQFKINFTENYYADESECIESEDVCSINKDINAADEQVVSNSGKNMDQTETNSTENYYAKEYARMINEDTCKPDYERNLNQLDMNELDEIINVDHTNKSVGKRFVNQTDPSENFNTYIPMKVNVKVTQNQRLVSKKVTTNEPVCNANNEDNIAHEKIIERTNSIKECRNQCKLSEPDLSNLQKETMLTERYNNSTIVTKRFHHDRREKENGLIKKQLCLNMDQSETEAPLRSCMSTKNVSECNRISEEQFKVINKADQFDINECSRPNSENWDILKHSSSQQDISNKRNIPNSEVLAPDTDKNIQIFETAEKSNENYDDIQIIPESAEMIPGHVIEKSNEDCTGTTNSYSNKFYVEDPIKLDANRRIIPDSHELLSENDENISKEQNEENSKNNYSYISGSPSKKVMKLNIDTNLIILKENEHIIRATNSDPVISNVLYHYTLISEHDANMTVDGWKHLNSDVI